MEFRDLTGDDHATVLALNNGAMPAVSGLDAEALVALLAECSHAVVVDAGGGIDGFFITLRPGATYASQNYRWFSERYDEFEYLDRIVVAEAARGGGVGAALYAELESRIAGEVPVLLCEVNVKPRNDGSLRFHHRIGFREVGQQDTEGGAKRVSMLAKPIATPSRVR